MQSTTSQKPTTIVTGWVKPFLVFLLLNSLLFAAIAAGWKLVPLNTENYRINSHHYLEDGRIRSGVAGFSYLRALGQYDAQWYLRIAAGGYPSRPRLTDLKNKTAMEGLTYAFFPLYPAAVSLTNAVFRNIELSAFIVSQLCMAGGFILFWLVAGRLIGKDNVGFTSLLLYFSPFSIFFRSYFPEGLFLLILLGFTMLLLQKRYVGAGILLGLLNVVKPNGLLLCPYFLYVLYRHARQLGWRRVGAAAAAALMPFIGWMLFCFLKTGDSLYFMRVREAWSHGWGNVLTSLALFYRYPVFHSFHFSLLDILSVGINTILLICARGKINKRVWNIWLLLWVFPLVTTDTMSYTKYQTLFYPAFLYVGPLVPKYLRGVVLLASVLCLILVSFFFVNWWWIG